MDLDILHDYLVESRELLQEAQEETLLLESEPENEGAVASIFRAFHTIKGGAGFLEASHLVDWAHSLEELLDRLRSHALPITPERIGAILKGIDVIESMFQQLEKATPPAAGPEDLASTIRSLAQTDKPVATPIPVLAAHGSGHLESTNETVVEENASMGSPAASHRTGPSPESARTAETLPAAPAPFEAALRNAKTLETSLRVDAGRLDAVMNQVGELVLLRNRLTSALSGLGKENDDMARIAREVDLSVSDLQATVMRLRMQPCKRLFQQLPRVVRDVSQQLNKSVRLELVGEDVEIDKTVVDALSGPMTHLVRNSLDHGIETPDVRIAANKPATALLRIAAVHLGDKVRIEVADDGKGIDRRTVTKKAIDAGILTPEQAAGLSEQEALELIFRPGFSTREQVSDLSGRGVGMDVVKETTNRLRGRLSITTRLGEGTQVAMEFPLSLAVLPVLYLRVRQDIYALPVSAIDSLIDLEEDRLHRLGGRVTYRVGGTEAVPLVDLGAILQAKPLRLGAESAEGVLTERGLFVVSEVLGNEDSVVKPIDFLTGQSLYQGATISGGGNVVLILDAAALSVANFEATERRC